MSTSTPAASTGPLAADFKNVQAHYDLSDEFFALFLDPSMTYSCAKFGLPETTLAEAQQAKIDLSLGKCELRPGMRLLDIGCGWGACATRAHEHYGANVTGLTLSRNQYQFNVDRAGGKSGLEYRLEGWETFEMPVDRIVSVGAFEHFGRDKYPAFFAKARSLLPVTPGEGVMLLHTITLGKPSKSFSFLRFVHFMSTKIFPGGDVPAPERVIEFARNANFEPEHVESLRPHYARTLDCWASNLTENRERAIEVAGEGNFKTYMKYLTDCAAFFRSGEVNVHQFKLRAA
jgi:cyclopropane-fatty-acyl-phospholipid synthase